MEKSIIKMTCGRYNADFADDGKVFGYSEGFCALTGYTAEQFNNKEVTFFDMIPPEEYDEYMAKVAQLQANGGGALEHRILCADGSLTNVICIGEDYTDDNGHPCVSVTVSDVTERAALENRYIRSEREVKALIENMPGGILVCKLVDGAPQLIKASDEFYRIMDMPRELAARPADFMSEKDYSKFVSNMQECVKTQLSFEQDIRIKGTNKKLWVRLRARYYDCDIDGTPMLYCAIMDITDSKESERRFIKQNLCFTMISENTDEMFFDYDAERDEFSITAREGKLPFEGNVLENCLAENAIARFIHPDDKEMFDGICESALAAPTKGTADFRILSNNKDNVEYKWYRMPYVSVAGENAAVSNVYGMLYCIDHLKTMKSKIARDRKEIERLSNTDPITGLFNRNAFKIFAAQTLEEIYNDKECFALVYSDINNFSYVNENFGYEAGNRMLYDFAQVIRNCEISVIGCRIYSDYFVSLYRAKDRDTLIAEIKKRNETFTAMQKEKYPLSDIEISCGLYFLKSKDEDINIAIDNANLARRSVKGSSDIPSGVYAERMRKKRSHDQAIASEIWNAMNTGAIELFLQPKFDLSTRSIIGAEALTRWRNPDGSYKLPYEFIDVLENVGYITQLDFYIYEQALKNLAKWRSSGKKLVPISVNFSRKHNNYPEFVEKVNSMADKYGVDKSLIEIEVTESCFTQDVKNLFTNMRRFRELGFKVDIDDFGMGYSSLSVLMDAPVDIVKVDKVFIDNIESSERSREYINKICSLIQTTQKDIIFEGVETERQAQILCDSGHHMAQGWLFDKAIPVDEFERKYLS